MAALNYGLVQRAKLGQAVSGDACLVAERKNGLLIGVADGLGSGEAAREAAERALSCLREETTGDVVRLMEACHRALADTRGAALTLLWIEPGPARLECTAVGNVEVRASQDSVIKPIPVNGIVGVQHGPLRRFTGDYARGELVAIYTDGISSKFDFDLEAVRAGMDPRRLANHLAHYFGRTTDDVTVLVVQLP
jgi:serine/threonine protein phosphatase PrpC